MASDNSKSSADHRDTLRFWLLFALLCSYCRGYCTALNVAYACMYVATVKSFTTELSD